MSKLVKDMTPEELERKRSAKRYREANREKIAEKARKYREENKDELLKKARKCYEANREKELERARKYYEANKEKRSIYRKKNKKKRAEMDRKYYEANKDKVAEKGRNWYEANKDAIRERIKSDPNRSMKKTLRSRFRQAFGGNYKTGSGVADLGMSIDEFRVHIESMFDEVMTWENRGTYWQFDHIYPLDKANLRDRVEFLAVANWRNYQPLEAGENIRKGNKVTPKAKRLFESLKKEFST